MKASNKKYCCGRLCLYLSIKNVVASVHRQNLWEKNCFKPDLERKKTKLMVFTWLSPITKLFPKVYFYCKSGKILFLIFYLYHLITENINFFFSFWLFLEVISFKCSNLLCLTFTALSSYKQYSRQVTFLLKIFINPNYN